MLVRVRQSDSSATLAGVVCSCLHFVVLDQYCVAGRPTLSNGKLTISCSFTSKIVAAVLLGAVTVPGCDLNNEQAPGAVQPSEECTS